MPFTKIGFFGKYERPRSSPIVVLVGLKDFQRECLAGFTFFMAVLGVTICLSYIILVTIPHSLWVQEFITGGDELFSIFLKYPGLVVLSKMTGESIESLSRKDRSEVTESSMNHLLNVSKSMGFDDDYVRSKVADNWSYFEFGVDNTFLVGFIVSFMLGVAAARRVYNCTSLFLCVPYILYTSAIITVTTLTAIFLGIQFTSDLRRAKSTVKGEHILLNTILGLALVIVTAFVGNICAMKFARDLKKTTKSPGRKRAFKDTSFKSTSSSESHPKKRRSDNKKANKDQIDSSESKYSMSKKRIDHFELGEILSDN